MAGPFVGTHNGALLVAGGANFPGKLPWEGGTKVWHDTVFALEKPDGVWKVAGKLPRPLGYGVSATFGGRIWCVGGCDGTRHIASTVALGWDAAARRITVAPASAAARSTRGASLP